MKNFKIAFLLTIALLVSFQAKVSAQGSRDYGKKEIKINLLTSILSLPEITYERFLDDNMGVGMAISFGIANENGYSDYRFLAIPHYRVYFGKEEATGFFIEANTALGYLHERNFYYTDNFVYDEYDNYKAKFNFGLGAAIGAKFLTRNGFIGEIYAGAGRFLGDQRSIDAFPRIGITIGKRF